MQKFAFEYARQIQTQIEDGVKPPAELDSLIKATESGADGKTLAKLIYVVMIEVGMCYDLNGDQSLTPTRFVVLENLQIPEVKREFSYLYTYGMNLAQMEMIEVDDLREIVVERLIKRTGMEPREFDSWLSL